VGRKYPKFNMVVQAAGGRDSELLSILEKFSPHGKIRRTKKGDLGGVERSGTHRSIAAMNCAWFLSDIDRRPFSKGVLVTASSSDLERGLVSFEGVLIYDSSGSDRGRNSFGRTNATLYSLI